MLASDPDPTDDTDGYTEWLVTNGLGGYASGTTAGIATRRFHGYLIAALPAPRGRMMMLDALDETFSTGYSHAKIAAATLREFRLDLGLPVWTYEWEGNHIEKRIVMPHRQNTVVLSYERLSGTGRLDLTLCPWLRFRPHSTPRRGPPALYSLHAVGGHYEIEDAEDHGLPALRMRMTGREAKFSLDERQLASLCSPGMFHSSLVRQVPVYFVASIEEWPIIEALEPAQAFAAEHERRHRLISFAHPALRTGIGRDLILAADQFIIHPAGRAQAAARAHASGDEERTIVAGYPWLTDWGRDAMIALEGLTLATGRVAEAGYVLRTFANSVRDGLMPTVFPEGEAEGTYTSADSSLWFFHALERYVAASGDRHTVAQLMPMLREIIELHMAGAQLGIAVDERDALLIASAPRLTWMDAWQGDVIATPRRGKPVEINALWHNAVRLLAEWGEAGLYPMLFHRYYALADRIRESFNARFWNEEAHSLFDVIDGDPADDPAIRPNQLLAISLAHPVLVRERWQPVLDTVQAQLLTPFGVRTLSPRDPAFHARPVDDARGRDLAYHEGAVWPWLVGPFLDAYRRVYPHRLEELHAVLTNMAANLATGCLGTIGELFDGESPHVSRGCGAKATSVAELIRLAVALSHETGDEKVTRKAA